MIDVDCFFFLKVFRDCVDEVGLDFVGGSPSPGISSGEDFQREITVIDDCMKI